MMIVVLPLHHAALFFDCPVGFPRNYARMARSVVDFGTSGLFLARLSSCDVITFGHYYASYHKNRGLIGK